LKALLVSKTSLDARFRALDSGSIRCGPTDYQFLRIRNQEIFEGRSPQFRKVYIVTTIENGAQLIIFLPLQNASKVATKLQLSTMHDNVKNAINAFTQEATHAADEKRIWIPQFKLGDKSS
jgi:hypothetical protein